MLQLRRDKISQRMKILYELVPSAKTGDTATMLDEAIRYVRHLQEQVQVSSYCMVLQSCPCSWPCWC